MTCKEASDLLDLFELRAPALREAGFLVVNLGGGVGFQLAAATAPPEESVADDEGEDPKSVLHDPWTHGRPGKDGPRALTVKRQPL